MNKTLKTLTSDLLDEHNTPSYIVASTREVLGVIDLDPMSNVLANETIRATKYYTKEDNGLEQEWKGNIWLNPPFSLVDKAVEKLVNSYEKGEVTSAVLLLKSAIETKRYQKLYPYPFCELNKRVNFISLYNSKTNSAPFATVLFYFGKEYYKWNKVMSKYGRVHLGNDLTTKLAMRCSLQDLKTLGVIE